MSVYFGNDTVNDLYIGLTPVSKGYVGTHLFYNGDNTIIDLTYEKYFLNTQFNTLYNTAEKPVKSAVLKGNSLVNRKKDNVVISPELPNCYDYTLRGCKNNTNYLIKFSAEHDEDVMLGFLIDPSAWSTATTELKWAKPGNITVIINSGSTPNYLRIRAKSCENLIIIEYQDGMEHWDIPYFEGMQSIKMPVLTTSNEDGTKTNILTCNEDVVLCGIGDVKSELNLLTGELTQRIGEVVLDGSETWRLATTKEKTQVFELVWSANQKLKDAKQRGLLMCDKFKVDSGVDDEIITLTNSLYLGVLKSKASTIEELTVYLSQNPITVQYQLKTESVKTVDLSVVNQDGNNTKLSTFNDITHVILSSEGLIPEAELEVATKNEEVLNTMSLEMDDISTTQNTLEETSNTQSENVDATMIATTEIYEQLL